MARIYVSSTYEDLREQRAEVEHVLRQGHTVVCMEDYVARCFGRRNSWESSYLKPS